MGMAKGLTLLLLLVATRILVVQVEAQTCGKQANFAYCQPGSCCSQYGYCGTSSDYCGTGCQSQCNQQQCGVQASFAACSPSTSCCSQYGFCNATGSSYCGAGCQSGACTGTPVAPIKLAYWYAGSSPASNINSCLYTHLLYSFAVMNPTTYTVSAPSYDNGQITTFVSTVRSKNPNIKTILSIGGGGSDSAAFSRMAASSSFRATFINSSIALAKKYGFDGVDLDWEYPGTSSDMTNLGTLFAEWRTRAGSMLLAAAVYYTNPLASWMGGASYPTTSIDANLDWVLVMSYDFHGASWEQFTNVPAPLYDPSNPTINADYGIQQWLLSVSRTRILLGLPAYGYSWNLTNPSINGIGAPSSGFYNSPGLGETPTFAQIAAFLAGSPAPVVVHNDTTVSTYAYSGRAWVAYDDEWSITRKVAYLKSKFIRGYGFWNALSDDSKFTLAKAAAKALDGKYCNGTNI